MRIIIEYLLKMIKKIYHFKKEYIIFQCHNPNLYCDNTKYLFEYLNKKRFKNCYWNTSSKKISRYLKEKKYNYININENLINFFFVTLKTKAVIDTGTKYFDPLNLISIDKSIKKITLYHGYGPKSVPYSKKNSRFKTIERKNHQSFDYINCTTKFIEKNFIKNFKINKKNCLNYGFPRIDHLKSKNKDNTFNYLTNIKSKNPKIILYTPTWRPYDIDFPLNYMPGMDYSKFQKFLIKKNMYFFYSQHSIQDFKNKPSNYSRIIGINHLKYPFYDTTSFMKSVKILVNDYSASSTDFSILKKPQLFYFPDFKKYNDYKGFLENYKKNLIGFEIQNYNSFIKYIEACMKNKNFYLKKFDEKINNYQVKYYKKSNNNSCELFKKFIKKI